MRITGDSQSFCENDISKNTANLDRKGQEIVQTEKRPLDPKILLAEKRLRNYSAANPWATLHEKKGSENRTKNSEGIAKNHRELFLVLET